MGENICVRAVTGQYVGKQKDEKLIEFLGIPYAKTPKRWKPAEKLEKSEEVIEAFACGPACWQYVCREECPDEDPPMSEDCLTLNVWTSDIAGNKPVYVWIHGGCYQTGSNRTDCFGGIYCGDQFVKDNPDIVYVNINYRVGPLGSMDLTSVDVNGEYVDSNNIQILDQMRAIEWVYENIAAFGGDPDRITIGGQSAGSYSMFVHMAIPESVKYIKGAICESSAPTNGIMKNREIAVNAGKRFLEVTGAKTLEDLLAIPAKELVEYGDVIFKEVVGAFEPCRDDRLIPVDIEGALKSGQARHVNVLSGTVAGEFSTSVISMSADELQAMVSDIYGLTDEQVSDWKAHVPGRSDKEAMEDLFNDLGLRAAQAIASEAVAEGGSNVYYYYMNYTPEGAKLRAQHCFEVPMIAGKPDANVYLEFASNEKLLGEHPDYELAKQVQTIWANFIRMGDPNADCIGVEWPLYTKDNKATMVLDNNGWKVTGEVRTEDMDFARLYQ